MRKKFKKITKKRVIIPVALLLIITISYFTLASIYVPYNATFYGESLRFVKYSELEEKLTQILNTKELSLKNDDTEITYSLSEYGFKLTDDYKEQISLNDNILGFDFASDDFNKDIVDINIEKLSPKVSELNQNSQIQAQDAKIVYDDGEYIIEDEIISDSVNQELAEEQIVGEYSPEKKVIDVSNCKKTPSLTSTDLEDEKTEINNVLNSKVTVNFDDESQDLSKEQINSLIILNEDSTFEIDSDKAKTLLTDMTADYDNVAYTNNKRTEEIFYARELGTGLKEELESGETNVTVDMEVEKTETKLVQKKKGATDTYIEVNIPSQHMWYYEDGKLVLDSPVVTGTVSLGHDTPEGSFKITEKLEDKVLDGASVGFDYSIPVDYWMRITNDGVGFHDGTWNSEFDFGSDKYLTNGSHGCINLPLGTADKLYKNVEVGTHVYITS